MFVCLYIYIYIHIYIYTHTHIRTCVGVCVGVGVGVCVGVGVVRRRSHNARKVECESAGLESMQVCLFSLFNLEIVFRINSNRMLE